MMTIKYLTSRTAVDVERSRCVWNNGKRGDERVELWADAGNAHVWAETNGDPVSQQDELADLLVAEGLTPESVALVVAGDFSAIMSAETAQRAVELLRELLSYALLGVKDCYRTAMPSEHETDDGIPPADEWEVSRRYYAAKALVVEVCGAE